jgi:Polyketide cyclase / dehydrase and lipid transport
MTQTVSVTRKVKCPADEAGAFITDMHKLVSTVSGFKRCQFIGDGDDGQLWDVFMQSGTIYVGGRVLVTQADKRRLSWQSVSGTRHSFDARVDDDDSGSRVTLTMSFTLGGRGVGIFSELVGRGIVSRTLEAGAEEIRHHLEFEQ